MHNFEYKNIPAKLMTPPIIKMISTLHEYKGKEELYLQAKPQVLMALVDVAKIQSTQASNRIEGIKTTDDRLKALVMKKSEPRNRSEEEIAGYREVLSTIHESYEYIPARSTTILQLHRDLLGYSGSNVGGHYKNSDNIISETREDGKEYVRFTPVPAFLTPNAVEDLCDAFNEAVTSGEYDPLLLIPMFILDFLCIHPFNDGNGRVSRLFTLLLLYRAGYHVGKYISLEMLIENTKESYYEALKASSQLWHESANNYMPFVRYFLGLLLKGYHEFESRMDRVSYGKLSKSECVKAVFDEKLGKIRKADIAAQYPHISITTIERALQKLLATGYIEKVGNGRSTFYVKR